MKEILEIIRRHAGEEVADKVAAELEALYGRNSRTKLSKPHQVKEFLAPYFEGVDYEKTMLIILSSNLEVQEIVDIGSGDTTASVVNVKRAVSEAAKCPAARFAIMAHNHPSGNKKESQQDINITKKLKKALGYVDVLLVDSVIYCGDGFVSMNDNGLI